MRKGSLSALFYCPEILTLFADHFALQLIAHKLAETIDQGSGLKPGVLPLCPIYTLLWRSL